MTISSEPREHDQRVAVFGHMETPADLASILCKGTGMRVLDATIAARSTPGVLPSLFTSTEADFVVAELSRLGILAASVPDSDVPPMSDAQMIHHARLTEKGLEIVDLRGAGEACIGWKQIAVISLGRVPGRKHLRITDDSRPSVLSAAPLPNVGRINTPDHMDLELWILCVEPTAVYCIKHSEFNYETLGDARVGSAAVNFDRFVRDLIHRTPSARQTPGTYAYLHQQSRSCEFRASEEIQQQALLAWILEHISPVPVS